ncbi:hypothetical protein F4778DRAFT_787649 [Xylariomycetidae sp. FL2044]|nr:hypothetical protein F4778DRAFT_787649 [Xylariomycetidae sp. FL2044]
MLQCRACFRRAIQSLGSSSSTLPATHLHRAFTTQTSRPPKPTSLEPADAESSQHASSRRRRAPRSTEWAVDKELQYLNDDPYNIAQKVRSKLEKDSLEEALLLTRRASSRSAKVTVSWNHLIEYQLRHQRLHAALKLYNEMKKRNQMPNAQTYTIIFSGCAASPHSKLAVAEAVKIYQAMLSSSRLNPNTVHLNAVLKVCAKAQDIESMFSIAQTANDGLRAPNNLTFTTVLNGLRQRATPGPQVDPDTELIKITIHRAKSIWEEVISRWKAGSIVVDEELVCAMGRLLLLGNRKDAEAVGDLLEQTMMIPKEDPQRKQKLPGSSHSSTKADAGSRSLAAPSRSTQIKAPGAPAATHALPGKNSLSMALVYLKKTWKTSDALRYWYFFTKKGGVVPDTDNWYRLLDCFKLGRNSAGAVTCMERWPEDVPGAIAFRWAMHTCLRDNLNRSAFWHATKILDLMVKRVETPDIMVMRTYLQTAHANKRHFQEQAKDDLVGSLMLWGKQLAEALDHLWEPYIKLTKQISVSAAQNKTNKEDSSASETRAELAALGRKMYSAYDRVILDDAVPPEVAEKMKVKRNEVHKYITAYYAEEGTKVPDLKSEEKNGLHDEPEELVFKKAYV